MTDEKDYSSSDVENEVIFSAQTGTEEQTADSDWRASSVPENLKTKLGICKTVACQNPRRNSSAFCAECSDKYHAEHG
jgi:hypothetical protein